MHEPVHGKEVLPIGNRADPLLLRARGCHPAHSAASVEHGSGRRDVPLQRRDVPQPLGRMDRAAGGVDGLGLRRDPDSVSRQIPVVQSRDLGVVLLVGLLGWTMRSKITVTRVAGAAIGGSIVFFIASNFAVWMGGQFYPLTFSGLLACYTAAIPFFGNDVAGNLVYSGVMFGSYRYLVARGVIARRDARPVAVRA